LARGIRFSVEGATFTLDTVLQSGHLPHDLEPEAPSKSSGPRILGITRAAVAEAISRGNGTLAQLRGLC
jgi:hypothetical protein